MAVADKYVDSNVAANKKTNTAFNEGQPEIVMIQTFETLAADDAGSIYRLFKNVNPDLIPVEMWITCDALTGATDIDIGFYKPLEVGGAVIDADALLDGADISAGKARSARVDGLGSVAIENVQKKIFELCADTLATREVGYDIALTMNSEIAAAGTISVVAKFIQG